MAIEASTDIGQLVQDYFDTWSKGNVAGVRTYLADDVTFAGPIKRGNTAEAYLDALGSFRKLITDGNDLISALYGTDEATLIYVSQTVAGPIRIAEHLRLVNGQISSIMLILDPTPLLAFRAAQEAK